MHNKEKFEELFRNNYESMLRLAMLMLKDDEEAKDVVGDIFAALVDGAIHTGCGQRPKGYLARCVRNRCLDLLGHRKVKERVGRLLMLDTSTVVITEKARTGRTGEAENDNRHTLDRKRPTKCCG